MGSTVDKIINRNICKGQTKTIMVGLQNCGKTTILYQLKLNELVNTVQTYGFNVESVTYKRFQFTVWDIGGSPRIRKLWHHYYQNTQAIIFVVDSSDRENIQVAREQLQMLIAEDELKQSLILILANKQDRAVMSLPEVIENLGLHNVVGRRWYIEKVCGLTGQGLKTAFDWLTKEVIKPRII